MARPTIGLNCDVGEGEAAVGLLYIDAVARAGGAPLLLPPSEPGLLDELLAVVDGAVLIGGRDYDPSAYGQEPHPATKLVDPRRDRFDRALAARLLDSDIPTLGICGGMQLLNIAAGGDLHQHIPDALPGARVHSRRKGENPSHMVDIEPDSLLRRLVGCESLEVNTSHHQAVRRVGDGFRVVARSRDGVIEAIEGSDKPFLLGVQWHPERLLERAEHLALFEGLVEAAARHRSRRAGAMAHSRRSAR